ncbi:hypothetical protein [Teredinibacter sp. KSP-S5-2]|uniref:hypothetical protein n=1 Tax=Teredinibacter sp. KSP-S5-2 TaxID=3034506 RepID=UPI0029343D29|nr:hypothetical protein [Teredinibacter sp. KSP-S5-2]WNO08344.1 hypothetical protein P5V12_15340 [Teredinibacter sp. KSP-S5-2]
MIRLPIFILILFVSIGISANTYDLSTPINKSELTLDKVLYILPKESNAHKRDCVDQSSYHTGQLTLDNTNEIDQYRCVRWVQSSGRNIGHYKFRAIDNRFFQVSVPYLTWVSGDFHVIGEDPLDEVYFPRLSWVGGDVILDMRNNLEYVDTPYLKKAKKLKVHFRTNNVDLNGQNALTELTTLELQNETQDNNILLNGLANLSLLQNYHIYGGSVQNTESNTDPSDGGFLEKLLTVSGNLFISAYYMPRLYGLGSISEVVGNLTITNTTAISSGLNDLNGLEKIERVGGVFSLNKLDDLQNTSGVGKPQVGGLTIEDNPMLTSLQGLYDVYIVGAGSLKIHNNDQLSCNEITSFVQHMQSKNPNIVVSISGC